MSNRSLSPWLYYLAGMVVGVLLLGIGAASYWALTIRADSTSEPETSPGMPLFDEAWTVIRNDYLGEIPAEKQRTYGAIRGSIESLGDPYTYFIEPEPAVREQEQLQGHFGGVGAYLELTPEGEIRLSPMIDRPASLAGIQDGDILIAIDGTLLPQPADLEAVQTQVRGPVGSVVRLTVRREQETLEFDVERAQIELPSVNWQPLASAPDVGYIRIERFSGLTSKELAQAYEELADQNAGTKLILDLRANPGGLLDSAIDVSDHFLDGGPILVERSSDQGERTYQAEAGSTIPPTVPVVVIVDGGTASAAEIVAGALQDRQRATLVGQATYGKGSIQRIHRLSDESAVHVTFARWYTPNGQQIDGLGLTPDVIITPEDLAAGDGQDAMIASALQLLGVAIPNS